MNLFHYLTPRLARQDKNATPGRWAVRPQASEFSVTS